MPLHPVMELKKERTELLAQLRQCRSEREIRAQLNALNTKIRTVNRTQIDGPSSTLMPVDIEAYLRKR